MNDSAIRSEPVKRVLARLAEQSATRDGAAKEAVASMQAGIGAQRLTAIVRAELQADAVLAVADEVARLIYVLARARPTRRIVEFGGSLGVSTIHLAAAIRDGGDGSLISTEIHPGKAAALEANLRDAELADVVEVRVGDALQTLAAFAEQVDLLFLDGWNELYLPVLKLVEPALTDDALVIADLSADDPQLAGYLRHVRDPESGWVSVTVPLDAGVEVTARARSKSF